MNLDKLDWTILSCLAQNCRLSHSALARIAKVSPHTIRARIESLDEQRIIKQYVLIVDLRPLGFTRHHVLIRFDHSSPDIHALCRELAKSPSAVWVSSYIGAFDTQVIVDSHLQLALHDILENIFSQTQKRISDYAIFSDQDDLEFKHALPGMLPIDLSKIDDEAAFIKKAAGSSFPAATKFEHYNITPLEVHILTELSKEPKLGMGELAQRVGCDRVTARRKVLDLIRAGVIMNFGVGFDHLALGFNAYHLLFRLQPNVPKDLLKQTFYKQEGIFYAGFVRGAYDLSVYLHARGPDDLMACITKIRKAFGKHILRYDLLLYDAVHHWKQVSDGVLQVLKSGGASISPS